MSRMELPRFRCQRRSKKGPVDSGDPRQLVGQRHDDDIAVGACKKRPQP